MERQLTRLLEDYTLSDILALLSETAEAKRLGIDGVLYEVALAAEEKEESLAK